MSASASVRRFEQTLSKIGERKDSATDYLLAYHSILSDSFNPSEFEMPTEDSSVPNTPSISNGSVIVDLRDNDDSSLTKSSSNKVFDSNWSIRRPHPLDDELLVPSPTSITPTTTTGSDLSLSLGGPTITFHKLHYEVSVRRPGRICEKISKEILHDVSGMFSPGMNAILGPTGCGKTSLLNILAGRKDSRGLTGNILVNGKKQPKNFKCMTGYVVQDDLVMGTLTVRENLMFSANLRLSPSILHETKKERVNDIIQELGLSKCADTKVGTEFIRGVSGGERKRTNIGMEMIVSPTVLFLDEPTTGLDASTANAVMSQLQRLSRKGRTIIFSIHQPRYSIFKQFDGLMLLAAGRAIYHGPASDALAFFSLQSYQCEEHNNPPDFFLDVINGDSSALQSRNPSTRLSSQNSFSVTTEVTFVKDEDESQDKGYTTVDIPTPERREDRTIAEELSQKYLESDWCTEMSRKLNTTLKLYHERHHHRHYPDHHDVIKPSKYATSFLTQVVYVSKRTVVNIFRNPAASVMQMLVMVFFAFTIGIIYYQLNHDYPAGIQNRVGAFFFIIMVQIFGNISAVELFIKERTIFVHECSGGFYRVSSYFVAKLFCDLIPLRFIPLTAFAAITYFMIGLEIDVTKFFIYLLALFLSTMVAAVLTFFISASVRVLAIANIFIGLTYVLMMVFGGILVNLSSLAWYVRWIQYLSIVRYTLNVLCINELRDATFYVYNGTTVIANMTTAGNDYMTEQGIAYSTSWDLWQNMMAMGAATFFLMILCYVQLRLMVKNQESK